MHTPRSPDALLRVVEEGVEVGLHVVAVDAAVVVVVRREADVLQFRGHDAGHHPAPQGAKATLSLLPMLESVERDTSATIHAALLSCYTSWMLITFGDDPYRSLGQHQRIARFLRRPHRLKSAAVSSPLPRSAGSDSCTCVTYSRSSPRSDSCRRSISDSSVHPRLQETVHRNKG